MKTPHFGKFFILASIVATMATTSVASAQSLRHDKMDARATRADLKKLMKDRKRAKKYGNWGKVAQDDRLIAADKLFLRRDMRSLAAGQGKKSQIRR